ncbi:hypothetical protein TNCV_4569521 [Trichonephila clavipes]|nr:hypothetical protein TNCV_4569521 [Trichonephila clavipes]
MYMDYTTGEIIIKFDSDDEDEDEVHEILGSWIKMDIVSKIPNLQHICLQTIELNLTKFSEAVSTTTEDRNLRYLCKTS